MKEIRKFYNISGKQIEVKVISNNGNDKNPIIFLHEGLGSVDQWKEWPKIISTITKRDVYLYSRVGMGNSSPLKDKRSINFMHEEALKTLPKLISKLNIKKPPILLGHSDGASISIIYAGSGLVLKSLILIAPHIFVEEISINSIKNIKKMWLNSDLKKKLKKYHKDVVGAFKGWCNIWLTEEFKTWNIEKYLKDIKVPILLIQGKNDEYGSLDQILGINKQVTTKIENIIIEQCGHSPFRDHPEIVNNAIKKFLS
tara:strand:+ start:1177 stop:1944 length:768 start_codon:yes stop_codon:yes gene_type:complete